MEYKIALAPDLGLTPAEFVAAWNDIPECREAAHVHLNESVLNRFDSNNRQFNPLPIHDILVIVETLGLGVSSNAIFALIKKYVVKPPTATTSRRETTYQELNHPDGTVIILCKHVEEETK